MQYPTARGQRLRSSAGLRRLVRETRLSVDDLVMPLFVREGKKLRKPVPSMPGIAQLSIDNCLKDALAAYKLGIPAVLLFGIPEKKDELGTGAYASDGIVQKAAAALKSAVPDMVVITDVCLCEFTSHGHCGVINRKGKRACIDNDATLALLSKAAVSQVQAGADIVAPSAMMDGQVKAIRQALDEYGYTNIPIMGYSAKYASSFYGPFREAAESSPKFGDRKAYQMDPSNAAEAMREIGSDIAEGADIVMVKPALAYHDIIAKAKARVTVPVAAYNVSGEYSMVKSAAKNGWIDEERMVLEILTSIKRAGADIIITYHAMDAARMFGK